ncbi:hypothetical protein [Noviherbaspirillum sp.]|uniref:hypothetical protein n=1 Tax=Noviherbaspirillum sp. TaxID=1926288 RepID=UPI002B48D9C0|nr:hypothetical protein [Noviherbaspirillum sp.]HJV79653.1 hypothetical protein [Noviherbaspirillum sp.]
MSPHQRALLPLIGLQGAVGSLGGFIGFFVVGREDLQAMFRYTAGMLTAAMAATFITYLLGPRLRLSGRRLFRLGFLFPGVLLLVGGRSVTTMAIAYGSFMGVTWGARHSLEMSLLQDHDRDGYASHSVTISVMLSVAFTLIATLLLTGFSEQSRYVYWMYGALCLLGGVFFGKSIPDTAPVSLKAPLAVIRQPQFVACLPLFFLESGLFGISQAMASAGAVNALGSASRFGWVATLAGLVGGLALFTTRHSRHLHNRANWFGGASAAVGLAFMLLGASVWMPALYIAYSVLRAAAVPFLSAGQQVLNQCTLDIHGELSDRIFAREFVLWALRMLSLILFWGLAQILSPMQLMVAGSGMLAGATGMEYLIGKSLFWKNAPLQEQAA